MRTSPSIVISCLSGDLLVDHNLIIEAISEDGDLFALFRETVGDFTEYPSLRDAVGGVF